MLLKIYSENFYEKFNNLKTEKGNKYLNIDYYAFCRFTKEKRKRLCLKY